MDRNDIARQKFFEKNREAAPKLGVVIPSGDAWNANFGTMLAAMLYSMQIPVGLFNPKGSNIAHNRNKGVEACMQHGMDYCLMIDSDLSFPSHTALRLLAQAKRQNLDVIGCTYVSRTQPHQNHAKGMPEGPSNVSGLTEVLALPTGMMLIDMRVFSKLKRPYFRFDCLEEGQPLPALYEGLVPDDGEPRGIGEDYNFCCRARAAGCRIWLDVELSYDLMHWGEQAFQIKDVQPGAPESEPRYVRIELPA